MKKVVFLGGCVANGIRTRVYRMRICRPRPLDDSDWDSYFSLSPLHKQVACKQEYDYTHQD